MKPLFILLACFVLIGILSAANISTSATLTKESYKNLSSSKIADYSNAVYDKALSLVSTDTVKNRIDKPTNTLKDCGLFTCELKVQIVPYKELTLEKGFIKGLANKPGVIFDEPFYMDVRDVERTRPTFKDVEEEQCKPQTDNKTGKNSTVCEVVKVIKETGTETYLAQEAFENTDLALLGKTTEVVLRAHKTDMHLVVDLGFSIYGQERWDAAWWNSTYPNAFPINCSLMNKNEIVAINGSINGFTLNGTKIIALTICTPNAKVYYINNTVWAAANDTDQLPTLVVEGAGTSYNPSQVFSLNNGVGAWNVLSGETTTVTDALNYNNMTSSGAAATITTDATMGQTMQQNDSNQLWGTSDTPTGLPAGQGSATYMQWNYYVTGDGGMAQGACSGAGTWRAISISPQYILSGCSADWNTGVTPVANTWTHIAMTWTGATTRAFYVNGTPYYKTGAGSVTIDGSKGYRQGNNPAGGNQQGRVKYNWIFNETKNDSFINNTYKSMKGTAGYGTLGASESGQSITFISKTPNDLTSTNAMGINTTISYNVSNMTGLTLFYKVNSSISDCRIIINGTALCGYQNTTAYTNVSTVANFTLNDNDIYPATYNANDLVTDSYAHTFFNVNNANTMVAVELLNVSNQTQYNFFEIMANGTSGTMNYWYCNSSYAFNNQVATDPNCVLFDNIPATTPYNHTHSIYSKHQIVPIKMNITSGTITGSSVKVTPTSYFILGGSLGSSISEWYVSNTTRTTARRTSSNGGNGWSTTLFTTDAHLHQFTNATVFYFYAQANLSGTVTNSTLQNDTMELDTLPPTAVNFITPTGTYLLNLNTTVVINFTASQPSLGFSITNYTTRLVNATNNAIVSTLYNSTNTTYNWNASAYRGTFYLNTTTWQSDNQSVYSLSEQFVLTDNYPPVVIVTTTNSTGGSSYYRGSILGYLKATDVENASLLYNYTWTTGGAANGTGSGTVSNGTDTLINTHTGTLKGQQWILYATVNDGTNTVTNSSATVTILNSPPSAPALSSPSNGGVLYSFTQLNVTLAWSASTDLDGDPITYTYCVNATGCASTSSLSAVVLLNTSSIYTWNVTASDGSASASAANWTFRIDTILPPVMSSISISPSPVIFNQSATCQATAVSDANMTAYWYFYVNFALAVYGSSAIPNNTLSTIGTIGAGNYSYGDTVLCQAYVYNGVSSSNMSSSSVYVTGASNTIPVLPITTLVYNFFLVWGWIFFSILSMAIGYLSVRQISSAFFVACAMMFVVSLGFPQWLALGISISIIYLVAGVITRFSGQ